MVTRKRQERTNSPRHCQGFPMFFDAVRLQKIGNYTFSACGNCRIFSGKGFIDFEGGVVHEQEGNLNDV